MTYLRKLQIALDLFCLSEIGMAIDLIFMDIANGGISKLIAMPISERQNKSKAICNLRKYVIQKYCELRATQVLLLNHCTY